MYSVKNLLDRLKEIPHVRMLSIIAIASILLVASIAAIRPSTATGGGAEIRATGTIDTIALLPFIAERTSGDYKVRWPAFVSNYHGTLEARAVQLNMQDLTEDSTNAVSFTTAITNVKGTLAGSEPGSFSAIFASKADRSDCNPPKNPGCPPGIARFEGRLVVIEGTGLGGFEGICGGGTFKGEGNSAIGFVSTYDFTFRFGKDCKANN